MGRIQTPNTASEISLLPEVNQKSKLYVKLQREFALLPNQVLFIVFTYLEVPETKKGTD